MKLFHLRHVDWVDSQLIYHAQARVNVEGINILAPSSPYVCIGYHQNLEQEVDLEYCEENAIPVFRREVGGGAVFLDGNQIFYQIVLHKENPLTKGGKAEFFERMLQPVVDTYDELGIPSKFRPVNDVITIEGRKISGTGAAEIGDYIILVGNLIADFDYKTMARVLRVPNEKYRDKVFKSMTENLTTIKREIGEIPTWDEMANPLLRNYGKVLGPLVTSDLPQEVRAEMERSKPGYLSDEWLFKKRRDSDGRNVKIATDVNIIQNVYKAPGGLIRTAFELKNEKILNPSISGDFFCYPSDLITNLEKTLEGCDISELRNTLDDFYVQSEIEIPGITPDDWIKAFAKK
jgi:lipoate---protein ligase